MPANGAPDAAAVAQEWRRLSDAASAAEEDTRAWYREEHTEYTPDDDARYRRNSAAIDAFHAFAGTHRREISSGLALVALLADGADDAARAGVDAFHRELGDVPNRLGIVDAYERGFTAALAALRAAVDGGGR